MIDKETVRPMTVLHVFSGDLWAGAEVMIYHLLVELKKKNVNVLALSLNEGVLTEKLRQASIETVVISESQNSFLKILRRALKALRQRNIDIIHSHGYKQDLLAFILGKIMSVKCLIATLHGMPEGLNFGSGSRIKTGLLVNSVYRILARYFTTVVSVSVEMKKRLVGEYGIPSDRITVIHNGIAFPAMDTSFGDPVSNIFHIGTVGRLVPVKDFDLFLEVASCVKRLARDVEFSILGEGPLKDHLMRRARELGIADSVKFLSARPDPFPYYRSIQLFLSTSLHEGFPLSILEALAFGLPVVAPRVGGIPEIIEDGKQGLLVETRTPEEFARRCLELIGNQNLRKVMGSSGRHRIENYFSSSRSAFSYLDLYAQTFVP